MNHWGGTVGEDENHGIVVIGGKLNVELEGEMTEITINYHDNGEELQFTVWMGKAPEQYWLNLPYCPKEWETTQNKKQLTFVGWTYDRDGDQEIEEEVDLSYIRKRDDYKALGDPAEIKQISWKKDENGGYYIDFYAVWAPMESDIEYRYSLDGLNIEAGTYTPTAEYPKTYKYELANYDLTIPDANRPGYTFKGWKMYAKKDTISNWNWDASVENPTQISQLKGDAVISPISVQQNFGNIVLVAVFEPAYADLTITTKGWKTTDANQAFVFQITGNAANPSITFEPMNVVILGNGTAIIKKVPVGTYTVTEISEWSWRYDVTECKNLTAGNRSTTDAIAVTLADPAIQYKVEFTNDRTNPYWLSGCSHYKKEEGVNG